MEEIKKIEKMETNDEEKSKKVTTNKASSKEPKKTTTTKKQNTRNKTNKDDKEKVEEKVTTKKTTNKSNASKTTNPKATTTKDTTKKATKSKATNNEVDNKQTDNKESDTKKAQAKKTSTDKDTTKSTTTKKATSKTKSTGNKTKKEISNEEDVKGQLNKTTKKKEIETKPKKEELEKNLDKEVKKVAKEEQIQEQKAETSNEQEIIEENVVMEVDSEKPKKNEEIKPKKRHSKVLIIFSILVIIAIMAFSTVFALMNKVSDKIIYGISIKGIDVSGLTIEQATDKMNNAFEEQWKKDITLKYEEFETVVTPEQIEMKFNVDEAVKLAYSIGRTGSVLKDNYSIINANISKQEINVGYSYNEDALTDFITSTGGNLPNLVKQSSYSIDGSNLIIDKGQKGICIEEETLKKQIVQECSTLRRKSSYTNFNCRKRTKYN